MKRTDGKFKIDITFPLEYPFKSPTVSVELGQSHRDELDCLKSDC